MILLALLFTSVALAQTTFSAKPVKPAGAAKAELVHLDKVWDRASHSAFTDLIRFRERWFLAFREAATHVSGDGAIRILSSADFEHWQESARIEQPGGGDLRDPKLCETPDHRLMLTATLHRSSPEGFQTYAWFSRDGREFGEQAAIGDPDVWLWRVQWHKDKALGLGYATGKQRFLRAYLSGDGSAFETINPFALTGGYPNETSILFQQDGTALCLLRRDGDNSNTAMLGRARPPYRGWEWTDLGVRIGGPHMTRTGDGRIVAAVRLFEGKERRTALAWLDPAANTLTEFFALPSGGDTSYAGLVFYNGLLHVSYYSSHEGRTSIYAAKVKLPPREPAR